MSAATADPVAAAAALPPTPQALLAAIRRLAPAPFAERSAKFADGRILDRRLLVGVEPGAAPGLREGALRLAQDLGMPIAALAEFDLGFSGARMIHFGLEDDGARVIRKAYLERDFGPPRRGRAPELAFLSWKWAEGRWARALYRRVQAETHAALDAALAAVPGGEPARAVLRLTAPRQAARETILLEVTEDGSPRRSFDLNFYTAGMTLADVAPALAPALEAAGGSAARSWLAAHGAERLGHVSAGTGRDGAPFVTVYFGAERSPAPEGSR